MSSEPPLFQRIINAWKSIPLPRFEYEGNLPLSSPSSVTRTRSWTLALPPQSHGSDRLPLYLNTTEKEKLDYHHPKKSPSNLSTKIVCMAFLALANQTMSHKNQLSSILGPAIVIAIVAPLFVMLVSSNDTIKPSIRLVPIMEIIGFLSFILVVLLMAKPLFPGDSTLWTIMAVLVMASTMPALRMRFST